VLLIDERPEEVTDMQRSVKERSSPPPSTTGAAPRAGGGDGIEKAKRLVECRKDVVISSTRSTRLGARLQHRGAHLGQDPLGRRGQQCLQRPKHSSAAARNIEQGGS